jgi:molybdenum ABC transporter molybdate-binding protein
LHIFKWFKGYHSGSDSILNSKLCTGLILLCFSVTALANDKPALLIATASNFYFPLQQVLSSSPEGQSYNVSLVSGSSGVLFAQIKSGAPFDLFLSADALRPNTLHSEGLAAVPQIYAQGRLVLWPADISNTITQNMLGSRGRFAIANPSTAPFGAAAKQFLASDPIFKPLVERLVLGNNIAQAFQFIDSGNAQMGLVAESMLIQAQIKFKHQKYAQYIVVPQSEYLPIEQMGTVLARSEHQARAEAFLNFLRSAKVQKQLSRLGYQEVKL